jgi:hypothetical protein
MSVSPHPVAVQFLKFLICTCSNFRDLKTQEKKKTHLLQPPLPTSDKKKTQEKIRVAEQ